MRAYSAKIRKRVLADTDIPDQREWVMNLLPEPVGKRPVACERHLHSHPAAVIDDRHNPKSPGERGVPSMVDAVARTE